MTDQKTYSAEEQALLDKLKELRRNRRPREIIEALNAGALPQGVRLVDPAKPEEACVFVFSPAEAASLVEPLKALAAAQIK